MRGRNGKVWSVGDRFPEWAIQVRIALDALGILQITAGMARRRLNYLLGWTFE